MHTIRVGKTGKKLNETSSNYALIGEHQVSLKRPCTVDKPVFTLKTTASYDKLSRCNYLEWISDLSQPENNNYYWIDSITFAANNLIEITCHRDYYATFKTSITSYTGLIARSSTGYDITIADNEMLVSSKLGKQHTYFEDVYMGDYGNQDTQNPAFDHVSCTMSTIGEDGMCIFNFNSVTVDVAMANLLTGSGQWQFGVTSPGQYINSCLLLPFDLDSYPDVTPIPVGNLSSYLGGSYKKLNTVTTRDNVTMSFVFAKSTWTADLQYAINDFRNYTDRFTKAKIWAPFVGSIDVPAVHLKANKIYGQYIVSPENGQGRFELVAQYFNDPQGITRTDAVITTVAINMAMDIPVAMGRTDYKAMLNDVIDVAGALSNVAFQGVATYASGGLAAGGLAGSLTETAKTGLNVVSDYAGGWQEYTVLGSSGSLAEMDGNFVEPRFTIQQMQTVTEGFNTEKGRPVMQRQQIGTASRFIQMYAPSLQVPGATPAEINAINATLASGIYIS